MAKRRTLPLLDLDPDLGALVPEDRRDAVRKDLDVEVHRLGQGPWSAGADGANPQHVGLLLLDGVISREVVVSDTISTELLGPGDVIRPWSLQETPILLQLTIRWNALTESRVAVLDRRFGSQLGRWPEVNAALIDRLNDRAQRLATTQAISQLNRVDRRLLSLFWHLAERWGRMTPEGVAVPLTLSHRMLGQLVGARRPTVSTAISDLAARDELVRRRDGTWLLRGDPAGVPTGDTERVIPIRRKLLGQVGGADEAIAAPVPAPSVPGAVGAEEPRPEHPTVPERAALTARQEVRQTADRLRAEAQATLDRLVEVSEESRRLQAESAANREERRRRRAEGRGQPAPS